MSWGILGPRTSDYQSLGQPGISQDVPGYPWDYLDLEQVYNCQSFRHPGYSQDYLDLGQATTAIVEFIATS